MRGRPPNPLTVKANAVYEIEKARVRNKHGVSRWSVTISIIAKRFGIKPETLHAHRSNLYCPCKNKS